MRDGWRRVCSPFFPRTPDNAQGIFVGFEAQLEAVGGALPTLIPEAIGEYLLGKALILETPCFVSLSVLLRNPRGFLKPCQKCSWQRFVGEGNA